MGLPGTTQGIGRVLTPLLAPEFLAEHPLQPPIAEPALVHGDRALLPIDEERLNQLRATGYNLGGKDEVQGDEDSNPLGVQPESLTIRPGETATFLILGGPSAEGARPTGFTASPAIPGISFRFESIEAGRTSLRCEADSSAQQGTHAVTIGCPGGVTLGVTLIVTPGA